ncbi:glycosyl transferase [Bacillus salacetis]|uniref:Glycosyl transferase n=1 Tax=Bacillus salacetis TaxID=2315464 RepID=A0A3A1QWP5_9BACI|nr:TIGR04540 family protein [Bacillus salacetis]RIW32676.1 glycosyl transferase [Bacillus salacetis]
MEVKLFYKTQRELATAINSIIDAYWENQINEDALIKNVTSIYENNENKVLKDNKFTTVLKQQCGKRRLEVVEKVLNIGNMMAK